MLLSFDLDSHIAKDVSIVFLNLLVARDTVAASWLNSYPVSWMLDASCPLSNNACGWSISSYRLLQVIFNGSLYRSSWG